MLTRAHLQQLCTIPGEWRRRGLRSPDEVTAIVNARLDEQPPAASSGEPTHADFFIVSAA